MIFFHYYQSKFYQINQYSIISALILFSLGAPRKGLVFTPVLKLVEALNLNPLALGFYFSLVPLEEKKRKFRRRQWELVGLWPGRKSRSSEATPFAGLTSPSLLPPTLPSTPVPPPPRPTTAPPAPSSEILLHISFGSFPLPFPSTISTLTFRKFHRFTNRIVFLSRRIHKEQPQSLELLELNASKEFPRVGLRFTFPHALFPFAFICKNEVTLAYSLLRIV